MTQSLEDRVAAIEARNARVEADKTWETSLVRRIGIALITYTVVALTLTVMGNEAPLLNAIIPVVGFLLSTLALNLVRARWQAPATKSAPPSK